jgi:hypothetical protein
MQTGKISCLELWEGKAVWSLKVGIKQRRNRRRDSGALEANAEPAALQRSIEYADFKTSWNGHGTHD